MTSVQLCHTNNSQPIVMGSGLIALDVLLHSGEDPPLRCTTGGTCGNVLSILSYLGWLAYPITQIGDDDAGASLVSDLSLFDVRTDFIDRERNRNTPLLVQENYEGSCDHTFSFRCPHCGANLPRYTTISDHYSDSIPVESIRPSVFFFDRASPAIITLAERCAKIGSLVVFEPSSFTASKSWDHARRVSHIVKYSSERLGRIDIEPVTDSIEIRTAGAKGLFFRMPNKADWAYLTPQPVDNFVDSAGAGDWCTAGLLHHLLTANTASRRIPTSKEVEQALEAGQKLAALNCEQAGARGLAYKHSRHDILERIWAPHNMPLDSILIKKNNSVTSAIDSFEKCPACI